MSPLRVLALRCLAAVAAGALWGATLGTEPRPLLAWVALAPLLLLLGGRRPALIGFLHGLAAWLVTIPWIAPTLVTYGGISRGLSVLLVVVLAAYLGAFHALFAALAAGPWRRGGAWALIAPPAIWTALEWLRAHLFGGFPWTPAAHAWTEQAGALGSAAWIGAAGVSFLVVLANAGVAAAARRRWIAAGVGLLIPLALLAAGGRWGSGDAAGGAAAGPPLEVRIVQPNIENLPNLPDQATDWETILANYRGLLELSRQACEPGALVVWPESAAWPYAYHRDAGLREDLAALAAAGCAVLFNSAHPEDGRWYNSAFLLAPGGGLARYDKRHLVPFGEYVPLGETFEFIGTLARAAGSFSAAEEARLLPWQGEELGVAICFEIVFPEEVADLVQAGATVLVTVTNDAWYGDTSAPWQHFRAARWRAAESRRPVLRAAITGVSGLIEADGSVRGRLGVGRRGIIAGRVTPRGDLSPASRAPWAVPLAATLLAAWAVAAAARASGFASGISGISGIFRRRRSSRSRS